MNEEEEQEERQEPITQVGKEKVVKATKTSSSEQEIWT